MKFHMRRDNISYFYAHLMP